MSGFDLPPVVGYDRMFKQARLLGEGGVQGPEQGPLSTGDAQQGAGVEQTESAFSKSLDAVRSLQDDVGEKYKGLVLGEGVELHDIMAAAGKSEVAFNLMLEVRNKLVDAWEKLSRSAV